MANATPGEQKVTVENIEQRSRKTPKIEQSSRYRLAGFYIFLLPLHFEIAASVVFRRRALEFGCHLSGFPLCHKFSFANYGQTFFPHYGKYGKCPNHNGCINIFVPTIADTKCQGCHRDS